MSKKTKIVKTLYKVLRADDGFQGFFGEMPIVIVEKLAYYYI